MKYLQLIFWLALLVMIIAGCGSNAEWTVSDVWARPGIDDGNSAVYFVINNKTSDDELLLSASSEAANHVELHLSSMKDDGTMMMQQQESIPIPAGDSAELKPGGLHVMLIELRQDLKPGDELELILKFQNAGEMEYKVTVREP